MDLFMQMVEELRGCKETVLIYGAGCSAAYVAKFLDLHNVEFVGFCVDDAYLPASGAYLGKPVYGLNAYLAAHKCVLVLSFAKYPADREQALRSEPNVLRLYALDFPGRFTLDRDGSLTDGFLAQNREVLAKLRRDLADDASRAAFDAYVDQRNTGVYRKPYSEYPQYFEQGIVRCTPDECFVDCGAYIGDSIQAFWEYLAHTGVPRFRRIVAFEADPANAARLKESLTGIDNADVIEKAVADQKGVLHFANRGVSNSRIADDGIEVPVTTIDEELADENVTFIKMDIEGAELGALRGAEQTIRRCRPKLAICVYHKVEDLVTIPQYIQSLHPDYKLYLRNYEPQSSECVLYAI